MSLGHSHRAIDASQVAVAERFFQLGLACANGKTRDDVFAKTTGQIDYVAAHKWFNLAALQGSREAAAHRQEIAAMMSKRDIAAALRAAREWMNQH